MARAVQVTSPKQVYLSSSVSAFVFFDTGFWNAFFPVDLLLPGKYKIHIDYKLHFWKAEYEFYVRNVEFLCNV